MKIKKFATGLIKKILLILCLASTMGPTVFADVNCDILNNPDQQTNLIITILEEEISATTDTGDVMQIISCLRKTTCEQGEKGQVCTSTYVDTSPGACKPGPTEFCQRVQVIFSSSGINLLMSYLGIIYRWAAGVIGIVSVAYMIWGGFTIATAQDDTSAIDKAKEKIFQSIGGLILLFLSAVILYTINPNFFQF